MIFEFTLSQKAKSKGGDKYICDSNPDFNIYVPQSLSRTGSEPVQKLKIDISSESGSLEFTLAQKAKSKGGDKYVCDSNPDFNVYVPQSVSRTGSEPSQKLFLAVN
jgi:hypothetical protein